MTVFLSVRDENMIVTDQEMRHLNMISKYIVTLLYIIIKVVADVGKIYITLCG